MKHPRPEYVPAMTPVTVTINGKAFPVCQLTGFQSAYDVTFRGCLGCGQLDHYTFKDCPMKDNPAVRKEFFNNLHAHKPQYRVKYERALELRLALQQHRRNAQPLQAATVTNCCIVPQ